MCIYMCHNNNRVESEGSQVGMGECMGVWMGEWPSALINSVSSPCACLFVSLVAHQWKVPPWLLVEHAELRGG